jgi:PQQ-dependent catabolism-associated CXXCW motif protein
MSATLRRAAVAAVLLAAAFPAASAEEPAIAAMPGAAAAAEHAEIAEPDGYRDDHYRSPVPRTLKGARVVSTVEAEKLFAEGNAVFVDVYPRAPKPPNLPAGTLWRDPPHSTIKGGRWLPNVGYGLLPPEDQSYFEKGLEALTGGDKAKPVVFYCLRDCWMSWNAGKRAMALGYTGVIWFPEGTDGWQEAGNEVENVKPALK